MKLDNELLLEMIDEEFEKNKKTNSEEHETDDHEGRMAKSELRDMIKNGLILYKLIDSNQQLPGWVSAYITLASDYMHSVASYMVEQNKKETKEADDNEDELDEWDT